MDLKFQCHRIQSLVQQFPVGVRHLETQRKCGGGHSPVAVVVFVQKSGHLVGVLEEFGFLENEKNRNLQKIFTSTSESSLALPPAADPSTSPSTQVRGRFADELEDLQKKLLGKLDFFLKKIGQLWSFQDSNP